jgi:hypothetical protein
MAANLAISNTVTELMNIHADIHTMFGRSRARALIEIRQKKELIFSNLDSIWGVAADTRNRIILPGG